MPDSWGRVRELADEADTYLDDDRQDEALYRRALANLLALQPFEESDEQQRPDKRDQDNEDDKDDREAARMAELDRSNRRRRNALRNRDSRLCTASGAHINRESSPTTASARTDAPGRGGSFPSTEATRPHIRVPAAQLPQPDQLSRWLERTSSEVDASVANHTAD